MKKTIRVFTSYQISVQEFEQNFPNSSLNQPSYEVHLNQSGPADLALILNHSQPGMWVEDCPLGIYKLIQCPPQPGPFGRFTRFAPSWADETLTPFPAETFPKRGVAKHPMIYNWLLGISFDEVLGLEVPEKRLNISCIASTVQNLPGHKARFEFVQQIEESDLGIDVYGRGRKKPLENGKLDGLVNYRFSIAIENAAYDDYFSEKVLDCWLAGTIPIYFGAANLRDYFPEGSFIQLHDLDFEKFAARVRAGEFSEAEYKKRQIPLLQARQKVIDNFSMDALLKSLILRGAEGVSVQVPRKMRVSDLDSYLHAARDWVAQKVHRA